MSDDDRPLEVGPTVTKYDDIACSETLAAADPVDEFAEEYAMDAAREREWAYWASAEGVAQQLAEFRADREKYGDIRD